MTTNDQPTREVQDWMLVEIITRALNQGIPTHHRVPADLPLDEVNAINFIAALTEDGYQITKQAGTVTIPLDVAKEAALAMAFVASNLSTRDAARDNYLARMRCLTAAIATTPEDHDDHQ